MRVWEEGEDGACREWERDLYGLDEEGLGAKRKRRGWMGDGVIELWNGDEDDENGVRAFMRWKGGGSGREVFPGRLPWEEDEGGERFTHESGVNEYKDDSFTLE